jgi:branched-subunit amino acid transport protein
MSALVIFVTAAAVTYLLRIAFSVAVPPERLPEPIVRGLAYVGPAALAALATGALVQGVRTAAGPATHLAALVAAVVVARWRGGTASAIVAAVLAASCVQLLA